MKKILCTILALVCILVLCSCDIIEKFLSFDPGPQATTATPDANNSENNNPPHDKNDETTYDNNHSCTTPADDGENTTPDSENTQIPDGNGETIVVEVKFQSGGIHAYHDKITVVTPATYAHVLVLFGQMHEDMSSYRLNFYLNGVRVDPNDSTFLKDGDIIYLEESGDASGDMYPCIHNWVDGYCFLCGISCPHAEWDDNRQCLTCGAWLGVDLLQIEIYENGEFKHNANGSIETTVQELMLAYYGPYPWDYWASTYEFYFNGTLVTDGSYMITESGILDLVTRG